MKIAVILFFLFLNLISNQKIFSQSKITSEEFTGTYNGLTENMEFKFTASNGHLYIFDEVDEELEFDLYDETNFGKKFKVTWEKQILEILDDDDEPTGDVEEIKVITGLEKL